MTSLAVASAAAAAAAVSSSATSSVLSTTATLFGKHATEVVAFSAAATLVPPLVTSIRGGGARGVAAPKSKSAQVSKTTEPSSASSSVFGIHLTPQGKSVVWMALGMAFHYLGYSLARPITVALFTSKSTGYPNSPGAFPFAMAFVSPVSLLLLISYGHVLEKYGPRGALSRSTLGCATAILLAAVGIFLSEQSGASLWGIPLTKFISGPLFVFRESYVQLLTSQYWSFMASVLTPNQSAKWFAPIAGLTSISSVVGGAAVSLLSGTLNLSGTLACTALALVVSLIATNAAYSIAEKNGFSPERQQKKKSSHHHKKRSKRAVEVEERLMVKAAKLFERVPVLRALFLEILASQGLATLLNICFVASVGKTIPDDTVRAGWVGNFYALINVFSMTLQFAVLPLLMQLIEPKDLWRATPLISLGFTTFQAFQKNPSLYAISASLLVMKVSEYSARRMLDEMVYVPLDFESRFLGKEIIGVFGYRFGKSLISLSLSGLTSLFGQFNLQSLSILSDVAAVMWAKTAWDLSSLVPTRKEAQDSYDKASTKNSNKKR
ncbi:TLC ATP/ADP transporter [Nitzschia inconspicua]|uniref:ADP,ATP carrier protein n=1 Tax=Nitzschia inconspicua TaxID=303405 RepID=A0A9K3LP30_9STRA|nr:TLC ATP/ADP transporter [Nitzschia inconspicua]